MKTDKERLTESLELIKKLKCCGSCDKIHNTTEGLECLRTTELVCFSDTCKSWELYD